MPIFTIVVLLFIIALIGQPTLHNTVMRPEPLPITPIPTPISTPRTLPPTANTSTICLYPLTLTQTTAAPTITRDVAEAKVRNDYDLPYHARRLGTLAEARLVALDYTQPAYGAPSIHATQAATMRGRVAWLLSFEETPALDDPAAMPPEETSYALYTLIDTTTGSTISACESVGPGATTVGGSLPSTSRESALRQPIDAARAAVSFTAHTAGWLPFVPDISFARVNQLPGGRVNWWLTTSR